MQEEEIIQIGKNNGRRISFGNNPIQSERQEKADIILTHQTNMINITYNEEFPIQEKEFWLQGEEEDVEDDEADYNQAQELTENKKKREKNQLILHSDQNLAEIQQIGKNELQSNHKNEKNEDDELSEKIQVPLIILKNHSKNRQTKNQKLILSTQANISQYATNNLLSSPSLKPQFEYQFATSIDDAKTPQNNKSNRKKYQNQSGFALRELAEDDIDLSPRGGKNNMKSPMNDLQSPNMSRDLTQDFNLLKMQKKQMKIDDRYSQQQFEWQQTQDQGDYDNQSNTEPKQTGKILSNNQLNQYPSFNYCSEADNQDQQSIQLNNQITAHNFDQEYEEPYSYHQHNITSNPNILQPDSRVPTDFDENEDDQKKNTITAMSNKYLNQNMAKETLEKGIGRLLFQQQQQQKTSRNYTPNKSVIKSKQSNNNKLAPPIQQINTQDKHQILSSQSLNQEIVRTQIENEENGRTITLEVDQQSIEQFNNLEQQNKNTKHQSNLKENIQANNDKNIITTEGLSDNQHQGSSDDIKISPRRKDSKNEQRESPNQKIKQNDKAIQKTHQQQQTPHSEDNLFEDEDFGEFHEEKFQDQEQIQLKCDQKEDNQYEDDDFDDFEDSSPTKSSENYQYKDEVVKEQSAIIKNPQNQEQPNTINQQKQSDDLNSNVF
ncbi:hypothetical protein ABPG72_014905, partial [Tetrahymena utriculariae]